MAKLTEAQREILKLMARVGREGITLSSPEISERLYHASYWAGAKVTSLEQKGLVERLGFTASGGRCFQITDAGRAALEASHEQ